jgi:uncharacterized protein (DUF2267 family)
MTVPRDVVYGSEQFRDWLVALKERALLGSTNQSYAMLRAVLHEVRDRLPLDEALRFADALPPLVRGIMLEAWHPARAAAVEGEAGAAAARPPFLDAVKVRLEPHQPPSDSIVEDVLAVLALRTPPNILPILSRYMPVELRAGWRAAVTSSCPGPGPR